MSQENKMFFKKLAKVAPPLMVQELLNGMVNLITTFMILNVMGIEEISAIGISNQIFFAYSLAVAGIVHGCSVFIGQYHGKGGEAGSEQSNIYKVLGVGFTLIISLAALIILVAIFVPHWLFSVFTNDQVVSYLGVSYFRFSILSYLLFSIVFLRNGALRMVGFARIPMFTTSVSLVVSFSLNYLFIFVLNSPIYILALAPVVARASELLAQEFFIKKYKIAIKATPKQYFSYDLAFAKKYFKVGAFIIATMVVRAFAISGYLAAYGETGVYQFGALQIATPMLQMFQIFGSAIGVSAGVIISNTLGAGERELAIRYSRKCLIYGVLLSLTMAGLLILTAPLILSAFNIEANIAHYVYRILIVTGLGMALRTVNFTNIGGILRGGGDTKFGFFVVVIGVLGLGVPLSLLGAHIWGLPIYFVVALVYVEELFKAIVGTKRVLTNKWANRLV
ncbi:MAG: MATE family efflux transporter [Defluviitaleaceae bacterium]|nr:MATE family efflux transporter [Defluviitaleaceae bacterium]